MGVGMASIIARFLDQDGIPQGPSLDIPADASSKQLETLLNKLLENVRKFYDLHTIDFKNQLLLERMIQTGRAASLHVSNS